MTRTTILKLGGSILTDKKQSHSFRKRDIDNMIQEIKAALIEKPRTLILVHGAGGAPHAAARLYQECKKKNLQKLLLGLRTHMIVQELNSYLVKQFLEFQIPVLPIHPSNIFMIDAMGKLRLHGQSILENLCRHRIIPLLYGDMIVSEKKMLEVLSGDTITMILANSFKANQVIFATDVDGVYRDLAQKELITRLLYRSIPALVAEWSGYKAQDVTGDLPGKLRQIHKYLKHSSVAIVNGLKKNNIYNALTGKPEGTIIE